MERTPLVTFVTPVALYHTHLIERVRQTVRQQTIPCRHVVIVDEQMNGSGWVRNRGLEQVTTEFVVWIDADDWLEPNFIERCLQVYDGTRYVYTDHWQDGVPIKAPEKPFFDGSWHVITTLLPTTWARFVDGFDESLKGAEDTLFYVRLMSAGLCGKRLAEPLFHYGKEGQRSKAFFDSPEYHAFQTLLTDRYGGQPMAACCGEYVPDEQPPVNARQGGDVLAIALWGGNRQQRGAVSGRLYPRAGNGARMWVYASDVERSPHLWRQIVDTPKPPTAAQMSEFQVFAAQMLGGGTAVAPTPAPRINPLDAPVKPDVFRLRALYKAATNG